MLMSYCGQGGYTTSEQHAVATRKRSFQHSDERYGLQEVRRYQPGWAATHQADLRAVLAICRSVQIGGNLADRSTLTVVASDFAGAGSLLVKEVRTNAQGT